MSNDIHIHTVTRADLRSGEIYAQWDDAEGIGPMGPENRAAILANPLSQSDEDPVQLIGTKGRKIIGRLDLITGEVIVRGVRAPIMWGSKFTVLQQERNSMLGLMLPMHLQGLSPTVGVCGPSRVVYPIYQALKWIDLPMSRYVLLRQSASVVRRYLGQSPVAFIGERIANVALAILGRYVTAAIRRRNMNGYTVRLVDRFPETLESRLSESPATVSCHRSAAWVNWLLENSFRKDSRNANLLYLVEDKSNAVVGYVLAKVRHHDSVTARDIKHVLLGSIQDWRSFDPALGEADIALAGVAALCEIPLDAIEVSADDPELCAALGKLGFLRASAQHIQFRPSTESPVYAQELREPGAWRIRPAEGDYYFF